MRKILIGVRSQDNKGEVMNTTKRQALVMMSEQYRQHMMSAKRFSILVNWLNDDLASNEEVCALACGAGIFKMIGEA